MRITKNLGEIIYYLLSKRNKPEDIFILVDKVLAMVDSENSPYRLGLYVYRMAYCGETSYFVAEYPSYKLRPNVDYSRYPVKGIVTAMLKLNAAKAFVDIRDIAKELNLSEDNWYWLSVRMAEKRELFIQKGTLLIGIVPGDDKELLALPEGWYVPSNNNSNLRSLLTRGLRPIKIKRKTPSKSTKPKEKEITQKLHEANVEAIVSQHLDMLEKGLQLVERQFACPGAGRIDLLCRDRRSNLVVIELKGFATKQDSIIGQITRYMGWVKQHLAKKNQKVRGFIVVPGADDKLNYAVGAIPSVEIKTFNIAFN
jgi:hypothetical protein